MIPMNRYYVVNYSESDGGINDLDIDDYGDNNTCGIEALTLTGNDQIFDEALAGRCAMLSLLLHPEISSSFCSEIRPLRHLANWQYGKIAAAAKAAAATIYKICGTSESPRKLRISYYQFIICLRRIYLLPA